MNLHLIFLEKKRKEIYKDGKEGGGFGREKKRQNRKRGGGKEKCRSGQRDSRQRRRMGLKRRETRLASRKEEGGKGIWEGATPYEKKKRSLPSGGTPT